MARRQRVDEFELPAAIGAAVAAYYGPRRFNKLSNDQKADIANACHDCARMIQVALLPEEPRREATLRRIDGPGPE